MDSTGMNTGFGYDMTKREGKAERGRKEEGVDGGILWQRQITTLLLRFVCLSV